MINRLPALIGQKQSQENRVINVKILSQETGISRQTLYKWLEGKLDRFEAETIEKLCRYFHCDIGDLLTIVNGSTKTEEQEEST